jgi:hypothetical protein
MIDDKEALERMIGYNGVRGVMSIIIDICREKAANAQERASETVAYPWKCAAKEFEHACALIDAQIAGHFQTSVNLRTSTQGELQ